MKGDREGQGYWCSIEVLVNQGLLTMDNKMIMFCLMIWKLFMFCLNMKKNSVNQATKGKCANQGTQTSDLSKTEEMGEKAA
jgi:hypothetical protein